MNPREALQELARSIVREAGIAQAPEAAAREDKRLELERIFEASKHMTTLSASALVLIFAAQRLGVADVDVLAGMVVFGFSLLEALLGMGATLSKAQMGVRIARIQLGWGVYHALSHRRGARSYLALHRGPACRGLGDCVGFCVFAPVQYVRVVARNGQMADVQSAHAKEHRQQLGV
jgi:hypothetical protein